MLSKLYTDFTKLVKTVPDYPKKGVTFIDMSKLNLIPSKQKGELLENLLWNLKIDPATIDAIVSFATRGISWGSTLATLLDKPHCIIRKDGESVAPPKITFSSDKEYGSSVHAFTKGSIPQNSNILMLDDCIATGQTMLTTANILKNVLKSTIVGAIGVFGVDSCKGVDLLKANGIICGVAATLNTSNEILFPTQEAVPRNCFTLKHYYPKSLNCPILICHPDSMHIGLDLVEHKNVILGDVSWDKFDNNEPNIALGDCSIYRGRDIIIITPISTVGILMTAQVATALSRYNLKSLTIFIPFASYSTNERIDSRNSLAHAETTSKAFNGLSPCANGMPEIVIFDIHATVVEFYFDRRVVMVTKCDLYSMSEKQSVVNKPCIIFPDDGAVKRYGAHYKKLGYPIVSFNKSRCGKKRMVSVKEVFNSKNIETALKRGNIIIIDDLIRSGGTVVAIKNYLVDFLKVDPSKINIQIVHADFTKNSHLKIIKDIKKSGNKLILFDTTVNAINLKHYYPKLIQLKGCSDAISELCNLKSRNSPLLRTYISSNNPTKVKYVGNCVESEHLVYSANCPSGVNNQPYGFEEIQTGRQNRMNFLKKLTSNDFQSTHVSIENGIVKTVEGPYADIANIHIRRRGGDGALCTISNSTIVADDVVKLLKPTPDITIGSYLESENNYTNNWIQYHNKNGKSRYDLLEESYNVNNN